MQAWKSNEYALIPVSLHFMQSDSDVLNSLEELWITQVVTVNSFAKVLNLQGSIYSHIYMYSKNQYSVTLG